MRCRRGLASLAALAVLTITSWGQPEPAKSTAQEGQMLPGPFPSYCVIGEHAKQIHCLFDEHDLYPTVAVIAFKLPEKPTEPFAGLLQKLETRVAENKAAHFGSFAIFLTLDKKLIDDPTGGAAVGAAESLGKDLKLKDVTLGLEHKDNAPLAAYGIDKDKAAEHEVTVLVYNKHKIERRFTFTDKKKISDADVSEIIAAAEKMLPPKKPK